MFLPPNLRKRKASLFCLIRVPLDLFLKKLKDRELAGNCPWIAAKNMHVFKKADFLCFVVENGVTNRNLAVGDHGNLGTLSNT